MTSKLNREQEIEYLEDKTGRLKEALRHKIEQNSKSTRPCVKEHIKRIQSKLQEYEETLNMLTIAETIKRPEVGPKMPLNIKMNFIQVTETRTRIVYPKISNEDYLFIKKNRIRPSEVLAEAIRQLREQDGNK